MLFNVFTDVLKRAMMFSQLQLQLQHLAVTVELKVARPMAYPLTQTLSVAYKHSQVCLFQLKAIENIRNSYILISLSNYKTLSLKKNFITNEIRQ